MIVAVRERTTGALLARGRLGPDVIKYEGGWYFVPAAVEVEALVESDRTATCASKGTSRWLDFRAPDGTVVQGVAWVYPDPKPGHEQVRGRYGFHVGNRGATRQTPE